MPPWAPRGPFSDDQSDDQSLSLSLSDDHLSDDHLSDDHLSDDQFDQFDDQSERFEILNFEILKWHRKILLNRFKIN